MARPDGLPGFASEVPAEAAERIAHCFGCGAANPQGLRLHAKREGAATVVEWQPGRVHAGWDTVVHGGLVATLIDETAAFAMFDGEAQFGMTRKLAVAYRRRTHWTRPVRAEAVLAARDARCAVVRVRVLQDGQVTAEGEVEFRLLAAPPPSDG